MAPTTGAKLTGEFLGTYLLVFTVGCNVLSQTVWAGVSIACVLMVCIYALGGISGANFNPAVSFCLAIVNSMKGPGGMTWKDCGMYIGVQLLGGILGAFSYAILFWNAFNLGPTKHFGALSAGLCETLYTFMLCFVVLNVAVARKYSEGQGNEFYGLAIGFVIIAGAYGAGVVSGGAFNPAVAIGVDTASAGLGFGWCLAYTGFELLGAGLAAIAFRLVRPNDFTGSLSEQRPVTLASKLISEFLGTFILVLTVGLNVLGNSPAGAFSIAASLMCMIYALGDVSGANFNPAVTLAILASKNVTGAAFSIKDALLYMVVQILGGCLASLTYAVIYHGGTFPLGPENTYSMIHVGVAEVVFTFVLCYVVLCTAVSNITKSTTMFGLAIGSCVTVGGFAIGSISGGSLNPAVSIAISGTQMVEAGKLGALYKMAMYCLFEFIGAGAAAGVAMLTHADKKENAV